jgi:hypothetical protein
LLFSTVYGPELESIYRYIEEFGSLNRNDIILAFTGVDTGNKASPANVEDAISFLKSAGMIKIKSEKYQANFKVIDSVDFKMSLIKLINNLDKSHSKLDKFYFKIVDLLFVKQNILFHNDLHKAVNSLELPFPCSEEKINAWRRVLEYLGLGTRGFAGMVIQYDCELVKRIIAKWDENEGPLQHFLHQVFNIYLPWSTYEGEISDALRLPLLRLVDQGAISLHTKQDLPLRSYFGRERIKWLTRKEI